MVDECLAVSDHPCRTLSPNRKGKKSHFEAAAHVPTSPSAYLWALGKISLEDIRDLSGKGTNELDVRLRNSECSSISIDAEARTHWLPQARKKALTFLNHIF